MNKPAGSFEVQGHGADLMITASGFSVGEAFEQAGLGLTACLTDPSSVSPREERRLSVVGGGMPELLVHWLKGWLDAYNSSGFIGTEFHVDEIDAGHVSGLARGEVVEPGRHHILREVKAVTWHMAECREESGLWIARVIVDV